MARLQLGRPYAKKIWLSLFALISFLVLLLYKTPSSSFAFKPFASVTFDSAHALLIDLRILAETRKDHELSRSIQNVPQCELTLDDIVRYANLKHRRVFLAANLVDAATVLPSFSSMLLQLAQFVDRSALTVSIYQSQSIDATHAALSLLGQALSNSSVKDVYIRHDAAPRTHHRGEARLRRLAELRNQALAPLYETNKTYDAVLFLNDIVACHSDALELLYQQELQEADQVCGTDWTLGPGNEVTFYDIWVARGINGNLLYDFEFAWDPSHNTNTYRFLTKEGFDPRTGLFGSQGEAQLVSWLRGRPIPVYSCWNGMTALRASLFTQRGLRFRTAGPLAGPPYLGSDWGRLVANTEYLTNECKASECTLLDRDIWALSDRQARIAVAPRSRCAYNTDTYAYIRNVLPFDRTEDREDERIDWGWVGGPLKVLCMPAPDEWTTRPFMVGASLAASKHFPCHTLVLQSPDPSKT